MLLTCCVSRCEAHYTVRYGRRQVGQLQCTISRSNRNHLMRDKNQCVAGREKNNKKSEVGEGSSLADFSESPENDERYINFSPKEDYAIFADDQCHGICTNLEVLSMQQ